ncbi:MAG: rhomboid family intramembrane serine protease [Candidatus Woesearchaeota archaeon]
MKNTILLFTGIILVSLLLIFLIPGIKDSWTLDKDKFLSGEYWRIVSYPFVHLSWSHLIENMVGLALVGFIAFELKTRSFDYALAYFSTAILAILPLWIIVNFTALGSSAAVYGLFGFISLGIAKFGLKINHLILLVVVIIFGRSVYSIIYGESISYYLIQSLAHFSGFVFGLAAFFALERVEGQLNKKKQFILRGG